MASFPEGELSLYNISLPELVTKLDYPSVEAMDHAQFRNEVREYFRKSGKPDSGPLNKPVRCFVHKQPCPFSDEEDSSSGEDSDEDVDAVLKYPTKSKLFDEVLSDPEPFDSQAKRQTESSVDESAMEAEIAANMPMIEQFDDERDNVHDISMFVDDNAVMIDGQDAVDAVDGPAEMAGLVDTTEFLTDDQSAVKMKYLGSQFAANPGIFPTFAVAGNKYISCCFNPAAAKDPFDPYGLKMFFLHVGRFVNFSDPKCGAIPLSTSSLRDLVAGFDKFVSHARSKLALVTVVDEKTGKVKHSAVNPILDMKLGARLKCPHSANTGQVWVRFVHAQNGDPLCVIDFVHYRIACEPDGRRPVCHTNFVVQVQTIFHLVKNVFPLMNEFQKLVCEKADALVQKLEVQMPAISDGRVVVNDVTVNPHVTWEHGIRERVAE